MDEVMEGWRWLEMNVGIDVGIDVGMCSVETDVRCIDERIEIL